MSNPRFTSRNLSLPGLFRQSMAFSAKDRYMDHLPKAGDDEMCILHLKETTIK